MKIFPTAALPGYIGRVLGYSATLGRALFLPSNGGDDGLITSLDGDAFEVAYGGSALPQDLVPAAVVPADPKTVMDAAGPVEWGGSMGGYTGEKKEHLWYIV